MKTQLIGGIMAGALAHVDARPRRHTSELVRAKRDGVNVRSTHIVGIRRIRRSTLFARTRPVRSGWKDMDWNFKISNPLLRQSEVAPV